MDPVLVCAAVEEELAALGTRVSAMDHAGHRRVNGVDVLAVPIGIGPVEAALGVQSALIRFRPRCAFLVGTCGALPGSGLEIGRVVSVERAIFTSGDVASGKAYVPGARTPVAADSELCAAFRSAGIPGVRCATTPAVTTDAGHAEALARDGNAVEHLECFSYLLAAARCGVPAACLLGIANVVGPDAHESWRRNAASASASAVAVVEKWIAGLA